MTAAPTVIYKVTVKATGQQFYAVPSSADGFTCYRVTVRPGHLACSCPDFTYRHHGCKHVAAVASLLNAQRSASVIRQAEQVAAGADRAPAPALVGADRPRPRHETALLYTDDRPFSIYKS